METTRQRLKYAFWEFFAGSVSPRRVIPINNWYYHRFAPKEIRRHWATRIELAIQSSDNIHIPRVSGAGEIHNGYQLMHNGQETLAGGYCGPDMLKLIERNRGVHEPQEERVFHDVLGYIPEGAVMLELGAYWAFYSMWFQQRVKKGRSILVEPSERSMSVGKHNFKKNGLQGEFIRAYVGSAPNIVSDATPVVTVDEIIKSRGIKILHVLHADIQHAERIMLDGCKEAFKNRQIHFIFISTHSNQLHEACEANLLQNNFEILASINMDDSYSEDGILVTKLIGVPGPAPFALSRRSARASVDAAPRS
jgi:hypothetical protein